MKKKRRLLNIVTQFGGLILFIAGYNLAEKIDEKKRPSK